MLNDLRFAVRTFRRRLNTNMLALAMLALGLGACAVIFSLIEAMLIRPLDFANSAEIVRLYGHQDRAGSNKLRVSEITFFEWQRESRSFSTLVASQNMGLSITDTEQALNPLMRRVSDQYFETLGIQPFLGRTFLSEEHRNSSRVTLLDFGFWQSYFAGDPEIIGKTLELAYETYTIVGVMPEGYFHPSFPDAPVLWLPMTETQDPELDRNNLLVFGRLAPGETLQTATAELNSLNARLAERFPETHGQRGARLIGLRDSLAEDFRPALWALFGAVIFVLLLAWTNVANLLLAQTVGRQQEIGVRQALGADRRHLLRQLMIECLLLALVAAGLGLLIAFWTVGPLQNLAPSNTNVPLLDQVQIDHRVALYTVTLALFTSLIFGFLPMTHFLDTDQPGARGRSTAGSHQQRLRSSLVVIEVALSLILLIGAGLMVRTFFSLQDLDLGFEPENLLIFRTAARGLEDPADRIQFHEQVLEALENLPGVDSVGTCEILPMFSVFRPTQTLRDPDIHIDDEAPGAVALRVSPDYFKTTQQTILEGRALTDEDRPESEKVAVISSSLARQLWPEKSAIGQRIVLGNDPTAWRIVGVAEDLRGLSQAPEPPPNLYISYVQSPVETFSIYVRSSVDPKAIFDAADQAIWQNHREAPVYAHSTLQQIVSDIEWQPRFTMQLLLAFATLALVLALGGLFAVLSYEVTDRRREIGVRVTVGADRHEILRLILAQATRLTTFGVLIGLAGSLILSRFLESQLYGVKAVDPITYGVLVCALIGCSLIAAWLPAERATRVDPIQALRSE